MTTTTESPFVSGSTKLRVRLRGGRIVYGIFDSFDSVSGMAEIVMEDGTRQLRRISENDIVETNHSIQTGVVNPVSAFSVAERFEFLEELTDMVVHDRSKAAVITGDPGLGKSFTVCSRLKAAGLVERTEENPSGDFKIVKGFSTPKSLYRCLYENNGCVIVFDDTDAVLKNDTALNILKGALDSYDKRVISWLTERPDDGLPQVFEFTGRVIFISNQKLADIEQAILSRSLFVDVSMTTDEKIERLEMILPKIMPEVSFEMKRECLDVISKYRNSVKDLNIRTLVKVAQIRVASDKLTDWKRLAIYSITTG